MRAIRRVNMAKVQIKKRIRPGRCKMCDNRDGRNALRSRVSAYNIYPLMHHLPPPPQQPDPLPFGGSSSTIVNFARDGAAAAADCLPDLLFVLIPAISIRGGEGNDDSRHQERTYALPAP
jgi:hypothetical protein